jgi:nucleotide-binding universal stress UspA family protein
VPLGASHYADHLEKHKVDEAEQMIHGLLTAFKKWCVKAGVRHREAEFQGSPSDSIIRQSRLYDLTVMGLRTFFRFETSTQPGDTLDRVLDHGATPVLGTTDSFVKPFDKSNKLKVLAAFDGSLSATVALKRFMQCFPADRLRVRLLASNEDRAASEILLGQAEAYLRAYGVRSVEKQTTTQNILDAVREHHLDWAGMAVVGAHAKKGLVDFMVGSLTKTLVQAARIPVFIGL